MTFTTPTFLVFLAVVFLLYWALPRRGQNGLILTASLVFYGWWDWRFLLMLLFIAGVDYAVARALMRTEAPAQRRALLGFSLASNLGALGFFKYAGFFVESLHHGLTALGMHPDPWTLRVILPVGISFYTFQALSYTIDVYRRQLPAVGSIVEYFSFITFFPHMVAGPIQQAKHFLVQFERERTFNWEQSADGLRQMLWGFFKKMVVADTLATFVATAYNNPAHTSGWNLLWATYLFAFQIYCDFSGYTDIAIGCARLFDLHMTRNFAYPYFAVNIKDFWRRWHISLSTWFREYLYIPLGGNRLGKRRAALNAFIVFVVSGFWHGANWTFLTWGALHGAYFYVHNRWLERSTDAEPVKISGSLIPSARQVVGMVVTFHLVCLAWVFFRASSLPVALTIVSRIATAPLAGGFVRPPFQRFGWVALLLGVEWVQRAYPHGLAIAHWPRPARWAAYYAVVALILAFCYVGYTPFIYFQF
jgi:alginate O-acetyltransferase complex protein AlgI